MADSFEIAVLLLFGLAIGSFLNVCIVRLQTGQSVVRPGSHCRACKRNLLWFENVPVVSWLFLRGRCRTCRAPIPALFPMVELATPLIFVLQYWYLGWSELLLVRLIFSSAMVVLFVIDLQSRILPNIVTLPGIVVGLLAAFALDPGWESAILGAMLGGGGLLLVAETYHRLRQEQGVGMGDVKMLAMIGAFLGWQLMLMTLLLASLLGSVVGIGIIVSGRGDSKYALPFGSFLALAAVATSTTNVSFFQ